MTIRSAGTAADLKSFSFGGARFGDCHFLAQVAALIAGL